MAPGSDLPIFPTKPVKANAGLNKPGSAALLYLEESGIDFRVNDSVGKDGMKAILTFEQKHNDIVFRCENGNILRARRHDGRFAMNAYRCGTCRNGKVGCRHACCHCKIDVCLCCMVRVAAIYNGIDFADGKGDHLLGRLAMAARSSYADDTKVALYGDAPASSENDAAGAIGGADDDNGLICDTSTSTSTSMVSTTTV